MSRIFMTETQLQCSIIEYCSYHKYKEKALKDYLIHIPMGGYRRKREAVKLKRMGAKKGVSDLFLAIPSQGYNGAWIELKVSDNKLTSEQLEWFDSIINEGYIALVCRTLEEFISFINFYLKKV